MYITLAKTLNKPIKYALKQISNIKKYGKAYEYPNINQDILEKFTPFRRLSKKPTTLSDPKYFISKFEKESFAEIPEIWPAMSEAKKIDFIVKNRYEKLVSNKIMNSISSSKVENSFILSTDGKIKYYGTYNSSRHCPMPKELSRNSIEIHNHPIQTTPNGYWDRSELNQVNRYNRPFSSTDLVNTIANRAKKAYVVDSKGAKFEFIPNKLPAYKHKIEYYCDNLAKDLRDITINKYNSNKSIVEFLKESYQGYIQRVQKDGHHFKVLNFFEGKFEHF